MSKNPKVSDFYYNDSSNMIETYTVKSVKEKYLKYHRYVGFVHDFDVDTAPTFQPDDNTGQLIEYLDPGHLQKVVENIIDTHNSTND